MQNILLQKNPNERNKFFARQESGHPHLWTMDEVSRVLQAHKFRLIDARSVGYYNIPMNEWVKPLIDSVAKEPQFHAQTLCVMAIRDGRASDMVYPQDLFPGGVPRVVFGSHQAVGGENEQVILP